MPQHTFCWNCWNPPAGPGTPFEGMLILPDTLRAVAITLAAAGIVLLTVSIRRAANFSKQMRFGSLLLFSLLTASIEIEHLGDMANWRLGVVLIALIWQTLAVIAFLRESTPSQTPSQTPRRRP